MDITKTSTTDKITGLWGTVRDELGERRAVRAARAELEEQLSQADIEDLLAITEPGAEDGSPLVGFGAFVAVAYLTPDPSIAV
jgi:hypothetical protein